ncbi:MAG: CoA pyrophosphatase [Janthinobacterium lividum]
MPTRPLFDPEDLPVEPSSIVLPAVPPARLGAVALRERFARRPLVDWTPERAEAARQHAGNLRLAAVLIGLIDRPEGITVLLTHRAAHLTDHAGQISFPGGRCDPGDRDAADTALREAWEEVALPRARVEVLGELPDYLTGTGYAVTTVVGLVHPPFTVAACDDEVAEVFEVPLAFLMDPANHQIRVFHAGDDSRRFFSMPYPRETGTGQHFIWGATAGMLRNLYRFLIA